MTWRGAPAKIIHKNLGELRPPGSSKPRGSVSGFWLTWLASRRSHGGIYWVVKHAEALLEVLPGPVVLEHLYMEDTAHAAQQGTAGQHSSLEMMKFNAEKSAPLGILPQHSPEDDLVRIRVEHGIAAEDGACGVRLVSTHHDGGVYRHVGLFRRRPMH